MPAHAKPRKKSSVRVVSVYTLAGCETCASLKRRLRRSGASLEISSVPEHYFDLYPTVIYSNQKSDNGERIFQGRCSIPKSIEVRETE